MLLGIDVGNTHTVLGLLSGGEIKKTWRISTQPVGTSDEFRAKLVSFFPHDSVSLTDLEAVVVSSVVPQFTGMLRRAFEGLELKVIDSNWPFSFRILAEPKEQVGTDRLVNAEAVMREYGGPAIIVDSGTATTLCALSEKGEYLGGAIMPGIELAVETLARRAAQLFTIELVPPENVIGATTQEALRSGIVLGYSSMIDGMIEKFRKELGSPGVKVIATGGVSYLLKGISKDIRCYDPDLTLKGISYLYESVRR